MQLFHQEVAADLDDLRELEEASRRQQALNGLLFQLKDTYNVRTIKKKTKKKKTTLCRSGAEVGKNSCAIKI